MSTGEWWALAFMCAVMLVLCRKLWVNLVKDHKKFLDKEVKK